MPLSEKERFKRRLKYKLLFIVGLLILLVAALLCALSLGASRLSVVDAAKIVLSPLFPSHAASPLDRQIVLSIRFPRVLAAICAGMALSCAGLLMQGIFQNPLVSPYTLGVSNGAAFGASVAIALRGHLLATFPRAADYAVPVSAFVFSTVSMLLVYTISKIKRHDTRTLILSGVAIGYLFSALVSSIRYFSNIRDLPELVFWTMGGLYGVSWNAVAIIASVGVFGIALEMRYAWDLNALASGEEEAVSFGVQYKKIKVIAFVLCAVMTASAVSFTGVIGFVGLVAPHLTRMIIGSDYRYAIPGSACMGALLLLVSDTLARMIISPSELPVGVVTSFIGVPFFLYLILRTRK